MAEMWEPIIRASRKEIVEEAKRRGIWYFPDPDRGPMRTYVYRDIDGRLIAAYWAPADAGFGYNEQAEAYLTADGVAGVYKWMATPRYNPILRSWEIPYYEQCGTIAEQIELGKRMDPEVRKALEQALMESEKSKEEQEKRKRWETRPRDEWGNFIEDDE